MKLRVLECPRCGAPLPRRAALVRLVCEFCKSEVVVDRFAVKASDYTERLTEYLSEAASDAWLIAGTPFRVLGRLASGHSTDVFLAKRATRLTERVVIKRLRAREDEGMLKNEQRVLTALAKSREQGAPYFTTLLPQPVAYGRISSANSRVEVEAAAVFREPIGFAHTLADVARRHHHALDPRHAVWIGRRVLELLSFVHRSGFVHGAVLPEHILIDAREHGARLVGYSCAAAPGSAIECFDPRFTDLYSESMLRDEAVEPRDDLSMLARSLLWATRSHGEQPEALRAFLDELASGVGTVDAWQAQQHLSQAARRSFGAPRFVVLDMS